MVRFSRKTTITVKQASLLHTHIELYLRTSSPLVGVWETHKGADGGVSSLELQYVCVFMLGFALVLLRAGTAWLFVCALGYASEAM